jgi:RNA methyltransferase, TrmH family
MRSKELVICGLKAVRSRFEIDSDSVKRLFFTRATAVHVGDLCRWMAQERLVYRCVEPDELERISGSIHHGGIVVVVDPPEIRVPTLDEVRFWATQGETLLLLDRISNVHNLGAIIRSAAFFGVTKVIVPDHPQAAFPTEATYRIAEGGLDHVEVLCVDHLASFIRAVRPFYYVVGAATRGGRPDLIRKTDRPCALTLGNEEQGLSPEVASACEQLITLAGAGRVESLNVSATAAILIWECTRP